MDIILMIIIYKMDNNEESTISGKDIKKKENGMKNVNNIRFNFSNYN